jgi:hypothetical protein
MDTRRHAIALLLLVIAVMPSAPAAAEPSHAPQCHALIVGGLPGSRIYARRYRDWITRFHAYLTDEAGVPDENVTVLSADPDFDAAFVQGTATTKAVSDALRAVAVKAGPGDQFVLVLIAHGGVVRDPPTIVLKGPDLSATDLAGLMEKIPASEQVVLNFTSSSGMSLKHLSGEGRVYVSATAPRESNEPVLAEFFLQAIETGRADGEGAPKAGRKDDAITLLEAYNWSTFQVAQFIGRQKAPYERRMEGVFPRGDWIVDGRESVRLFKKLYDGDQDEPGSAALAPESRDDIPDPIVELKPPEGRPTVEKWDARRVLGEHATLEDCGRRVGASALTPWVRPEKQGGDASQGREDDYDPDDGGYAPLAGRRPGEPGYLARQIVLGRPGRHKEKKPAEPDASSLLPRGRRGGGWAPSALIVAVLAATEDGPADTKAPTRLELLEAGAEEAKHRLEYAEEQVPKTKEHIEGIRKRLVKLEAEHKEAEAQLANATKALEAARAAAEKAKQDLRSAESAHKEANRAKDTARKRVASTDREVADARRRKDAAERAAKTKGDEKPDPKKLEEANAARAALVAAEKANQKAKEAFAAADEKRDRTDEAVASAKIAKRDADDAERAADRVRREADRNLGRKRHDKVRAERELRQLQERLERNVEGLAKARVLVGVAARAAKGDPDVRVTDWRAKWRTVSSVERVRRLFVHPVYPDIAAVSTPEGLVLSTDGGGTWKKLPATAPDRIGAINDVAFVPARKDTFYLASETSGVWRTGDAGRTARRAGSTETGLAHDCVKGIFLYPADRNFHTLYAVHGERAGGISHSYNEGERWYVSDKQYHVRDLAFQPFPDGRTCAIFLVAGTTEKPDIVNLYAQVVERLGGPEWFALGRSDVIRADSQACPWRDAPLFMATLDKGLLKIEGSWGGAAVRTLLEGVGRSWAAGGTTWGPRANELLFAYDPKRLGLIVSENEFDTEVSLSGDLYVNAYVRDGASLRASADGGRYYAVVNGRLWIGEVRGRRFDIHDVTLQPRVLPLAPPAKDGKPRTVALTARVDGRPEAVFADLRPLGGPSRAPMLDDGRHGDGSPGDGVYGLRWDVPAELLQHGLPYSSYHERRKLMRSYLGKQGLIGVAVCARDDQGHTEGASGVLLALRPAELVIADSRVHEVKAAAGKPWRAEMGLPGGDYGFDISGYPEISFRIRSDKPHSAALEVQMGSWNRSGYEGSASADLGTVDLTKEYARVVVPLEKFLGQDGAFIPLAARWVHVHGKAEKAGRYWVTDLRVHGSQSKTSRTARSDRQARKSD